VQLWGGQRDKNVLYVVTNRVIAAPVNGAHTEGGKIVAVSGTYVCKCNAGSGGLLGV